MGFISAKEFTALRNALAVHVVQTASLFVKDRNLGDFDLLAYFQQSSSELAEEICGEMLMFGADIWPYAALDPDPGEAETPIVMEVTNVVPFPIAA